MPDRIDAYTIAKAIRDNVEEEVARLDALVASLDPDRVTGVVRSGPVPCEHCGEADAYDGPLCGDETCEASSCRQAAIDAWNARMESEARDIVRGLVQAPEAIDLLRSAHECVTTNRGGYPAMEINLFLNRVDAAAGRPPSSARHTIQPVDDDA